MKTKTTLILLLFISFYFIGNSQTIWNGPSVTITKADFSNWNLEVNQDRITPSVWLTRKDNEGQFNIAQEAGYSSGNGSPVDTEWGWGTTADIGSITFYNWRDATKNNNPYGNHENIADGPMVLHLITDNIFIDLQYYSWTSQGGGGFSYTRSSDPALTINDFEVTEVKVYPIPSKDYLYIKNLNQNQNLKVFDILGKKLFEIPFEVNLPINITSLDKGLYLLKTENNLTTRFIKN